MSRENVPVVYNDVLGMTSRVTSDFIRFVTVRRTVYNVLKGSFQLKLNPQKHYEITGQDIFLFEYDDDDIAYDRLKEFDNQTHRIP